MTSGGGQIGSQVSPYRQTKLLQPRNIYGRRKSPHLYPYYWSGRICPASHTLRRIRQPSLAVFVSTLQLSESGLNESS